MDELQSIGIGFWAVLKLVFSLILNHLPYFSLMLFGGFVIGIIIGFFVTRILRKRGFFSRPGKKKGYRFLAKFYRPLLFLSILFLSMTLMTWWATGNIVEKEVNHGVESSFKYLEDNYLNDVAVRQDIYNKAELLLKGGTVLKSFNHALAPNVVKLANEHENSNFLVKKISSVISASLIEEKLLEIEKGLLFYFSAMALEKAQINPGDLYSYEIFEKGFDSWYNMEWESDSKGIKASITSLIYKQLSPFIFSLFLPFILVSLGIICLPFIDFLIYSKRNKNKLIEK